MMKRGKRFAEHIGGPIANTQIYIVDRELQAVGVGVLGEICIGEAGVSRGYVHCGELTAGRFVPNAFSDQGGQRLYRTGDVGRWRREGVIQFVGRRDQQVKVRGYRIELGEVERALQVQPGVKEAVVLMLAKDGGDKRLVGFVVAENDVMLTVAALRDGVRGKLPEYMIPMIVLMRELLLTTNGKVDRRALPGMDEFEQRKREYEGPRIADEEILCGIWEEMLNIEKIGVGDNFFELGAFAAGDPGNL